MSGEPTWWDVVEELKKECEGHHTCVSQRAIDVIRQQQRKIQHLKGELEDSGLSECEGCSHWEVETFITRDDVRLCRECGEAAIESSSEDAEKKEDW